MFNELLGAMFGVIEYIVEVEDDIFPISLINATM